MARVMKKFETEGEYQEWVDSPWMRTPYTCFVRSTGNVHYFDGDDNDLSITLVIRKTGWMKIGSSRIMSVITGIYKNGESININNSQYIANGKQSSHYGRHDDDYETKDDYKSRSQVDEPLYERGGYTPKNFFDLSKEQREGIILNALPRRFSMLYQSYRCATIRISKESKRFLYVQKGDVIKFVFINDKYFIQKLIYEYEVGNGPAFIDMFQGDIKEPRMNGIHKFAKEIIIGDGFHGIFNGTKGLRTKRCKKVFLGKNITKCTDYGNDQTRYRIYGRKNTVISSNRKIIKF